MKPSEALKRYLDARDNFQWAWKKSATSPLPYELDSLEEEMADALREFDEAISAVAKR